MKFSLTANKNYSINSSGQYRMQREFHMRLFEGVFENAQNTAWMWISFKTKRAITLSQFLKDSIALNYKNFNTEPRHKLWASVVIAGKYIRQRSSVWSLVFSVIQCKNFHAKWHRSYRSLFPSWICWKCWHDDEVTSAELKSSLSRILIINNLLLYSTIRHFSRTLLTSTKSM